MPSAPDFEDLVEAHVLLERAVANDRRAAELIWEDIAHGGMTFLDDPRWIQHVAKRVVRTIIKDDPDRKNRAQLAIQALGLAGRSNRDEEIYRELVASQTFRNWDTCAEKDGGEPDAPMTRTAIARDFIRAKLISPTSNIRAAAKRLDRIAKKFDRSR